MGHTYILSDYTTFNKHVINTVGFKNSEIISLPICENEIRWHDWTTQLFKDYNLNKLIIPISIPMDNSIKIALHIRLNYELTLSQRLIPIVFLSDFNIDVILRKNNFDPDNNPQNLLFTKGIYLSSFDTEEIKRTIEKAKPCIKEDYQKEVLNKLTILKKASTGKHNIANAWGCFKLAQVTGFRDEIFKHDAISSLLKTLYAKYLICYNDAFTQEMRIDLNALNCPGKKILFIDDQSDEGWSELMKKIFDSTGKNFVSVNSAKYKNKETRLFHDFEGFYDECRTHIGKDWDLIIIDLRLNPEEEDIDSKLISPDNFSGYKLITDFLSENKGYQIIISTASNKIWNINAALDKGASSYYVKESPDFNYSITDTFKHYENFKKDVQKCFKRSYLKEIYKEWNSAKQEKTNINLDFISESNSMLDIAWNLICQEQLDFGFLSLFQIIESFANKNYNYRDNSINISGSRIVMIEDNEDKEKWKLKFNRDKENGDYFNAEEFIQKKGIPATILYETSCLLKYSFGKKDVFLKRFGQLNKIRNNIAHHGAKKYAKKEDVIEILRIITMFRQNHK